MVFSEVCKIYQQGEKFLVLNPLVPAWIVTNINGVLLLKLYTEDKSFEFIANEFKKYAPDFPCSTIIEFLEYAKNESLFEMPTEEFKHKPYRLSAIYLNMTEACNLHCKYCFATERIENNRLLNLSDYRKLLDEAFHINSDIEIIFTGGEPLLSENTLPVAKYAKRLGFRCKLMTNATLIDENNVDNLMMLFNHFKISVDGSCAEKHDYYRGKGSYYKTKKAIDLLLSRDAEVLLAMVVTKKNIDDVELAAKQWGNLLIFQPLFPLGSAKEDKDLYLSGREYYEALSEKANIIPYPDITSVIKRHRDNCSLLKCSIGDGEISISCSGDVYPCQLLHFPQFKIGNVIEQSLGIIYNSSTLDKFKYHTIEDIDKCCECDLKLICGGSCQARHFSETGNISEAGSFCEYERLAIINGLINSARLQEL